jgi:hypothetical protein
VEAFWADAENLFETARQSSQSGGLDCDWAILIGPQGDIRMLEAGGWALPSLLAQHGAETAYRVTREAGRVCLEGRRGSQTCMLRSETPAATAQRLLGYNVPIVWSAPGPALLAQADSTPPRRDIWKMFA